MTDNKKNLVDNDSLIFRPFPLEKITIKREHYSTSLDARGYIPVYEYQINNTPIMWDRETGYVHFTGIWKALGNSKSDIVKMVDSNPELGTKKIRGGFLRIQGTWIPYNYAYLLCKRTAYKIRNDLIPIFGPKFPGEALPSTHQDFGCLLLNPTGPAKSQHKRNTTMRTQSKTPKPYGKSPRQTKKALPAKSTRSKKSSLKPKPIKSCSSKKGKEVVHELLTEDVLSSEEEDQDMDDIHSLSSLSSYDTPRLTPSPTFRVIQTYPTVSDCQLPPINSLPVNIPTASSSSNTTPLPSVSGPCVSQDIIDTISATILLQRLSQDDGARPFKPLISSYIPKKVIVGHQEFTICWD